MVETWAWVLIKNTQGVPDRFTGRVYPFVAQYGKPIPLLKAHAPTALAWQPIPEMLAWACVQQLLAAGGNVGELERAAVGLDRTAVC